MIFIIFKHLHLIFHYVKIFVPSLFLACNPNLLEQLFSLNFPPLLTPLLSLSNGIYHFSFSHSVLFVLDMFFAFYLVYSSRFLQYRFIWHCDLSLSLLHHWSLLLCQIWLFLLWRLPSYSWCPTGLSSWSLSFNLFYPFLVPIFEQFPITYFVYADNIQFSFTCSPASSLIDRKSVV